MKKNNFLFMKFFIFLLFILSSVAEAKKRKIYTIDFQNEFVQGHVKNPSIFQLFDKQQLEYGKIIDLKKNFLPEMRRTSDEIE